MTMMMREGEAKQDFEENERGKEKRGSRYMRRKGKEGGGVESKGKGI